MRAAWSVFWVRARALLQYRTAAVAAFGTRLVWGLMRMMIFDAFYRSSSMIQPLSHEQMMGYVWLGQAMLALVLWRVDADVHDMVRTGSLACELTRPVDVYWMWFVRTAAGRFTPTVMQAGPIVLLAMLVFGLRPPPTAGAFLAWGLLTGVALVLATALSMVVTVTMLYTVSPAGGVMLASTLTYALSGMLIPLPLFPPALCRILQILPFGGLIDVPFRAWLGNIGGWESMQYAALELAWTVALVWCGRTLLQRGLQRAVVLGG